MPPNSCSNFPALQTLTLLLQNSILQYWVKSLSGKHLSFENLFFVYFFGRVQKNFLVLKGLSLCWWEDNGKHSGRGTKIRAGRTKYTYSPPVPQPLSTVWPAAEIKIHFHFLTSGTSWRRGKDESPRVVTARGELGFCNWGIMSLLDVRQFLSSSLWGKGTPSPFSWYHLQNLMYRTNTLGPWYYQVWNTFKICTFWLMIDFFFPFSTWTSKRGFPILSARGTRLKSSWLPRSRRLTVT